MSPNESEIRQRLERVNRVIASLTADLDKLQAQRDSLVRQLCDLEGAHDQRHVGVR